MIIPSRAAVERRLPWVLAVVAAVIGAVGWAAFYRLGLILSHYDAKAHLVVARRVIDNLTPGWQQIGAVWLPLPHLIELLPTQVDFFYRTGVFASCVSIACLSVSTYAAARIVLNATGSQLAACVSAALLILNPNLLYLSVTPMTEPLLLATTFLAVAWLMEWIVERRDDVPTKLRFVLFAAMWTRYEAWPVVATAIPAAGLAMWCQGLDAVSVAKRIARAVVWPLSAVALFLLNSRVTVGSWFVSEGFFVPDPAYAGQVTKSLVGVWWGTHELGGFVLEVAGLAGALAGFWRGWRSRADAALMIVPALLAVGALPLSAFYSGHPYRIRYMVPLVAGCAVLAGLAIGLVADSGKSVARWAAGGLAVVLLAGLLFESPPWDSRAPMIVEAQWDHEASVGRRAVTACLTRGYHGEKILASMGSLAHYMQELSNQGFDLADFVHEGTGVIWNLALETGPAPEVGWMLVEEVAEDGDVLARRLRQDARFGAGMARVCEGGGVALYERTPLR